MPFYYHFRERDDFGKGFDFFFKNQEKKTFLRVKICKNSRKKTQALVVLILALAPNWYLKKMPGISGCKNSGILLLQINPNFSLASANFPLFVQSKRVVNNKIPF